MSKWLARWASICAVVACTVSLSAAVAYADTLQSAHYQFDESDLGGGGLVQSSSANYQSDLSTADAAIGNSSSTNYQVEAGSKTTANPTLSFIVNSSTASFGSFSATTPATATSTFSVSNYTSYGYIVQIVGDPPKNGNHTIAAMSTTGPSQTGIEQFGINLVANTSPATVGANPDHGQFGFGSAAPNYGTANQYRYVSGETIVTAPKSSGVTTYTITYLVNVGSLTPGGQYSADEALVCTGTF